MILFMQQVAAQINTGDCSIVQQGVAQCIQKLSVLFSISQQVAGHLAWLFCSIVQEMPAQFTQSFSQQTVDQFISLFTQGVPA